MPTTFRPYHQNERPRCWCATASRLPEQAVRYGRKGPGPVMLVTVEGAGSVVPGIDDGVDFESLRTQSSTGRSARRVGRSAPERCYSNVAATMLRTIKWRAMRTPKANWNCERKFATSSLVAGPVRLLSVAELIREVEWMMSAARTMPTATVAMMTGLNIVVKDTTVSLPMAVHSGGARLMPGRSRWTRWAGAVARRRTRIRRGTGARIVRHTHVADATDQRERRS